MTTSTDDALLTQLRAAFAVEARQRLDTLNHDLVVVEQGGDDLAPVLEELRREAHTLKGAARAAELNDAAAIAHDLETRLRAWEDAGETGRLDEVYRLVDRFVTAASLDNRPTAGEDSTPTLPDITLDLVASATADLVALNVALRNGARELDALAAQAAPEVRRQLHRRAVTLTSQCSDLRRIIDQLADSTRRARLTPVGDALTWVHRVVRDLAHARGKDVTVVVDAGDLDADRAVLTSLSTPLTHLLRNAVEHGIEPPATRAAAGKPPTGTITVRVAERAGMLEVSVGDDGAGIEIDAVRRAAAVLGVADAVADDHAAAQLVLSPGLTTATEVTELSGRGMGLSAVRTAVADAGGTVDVTTRSGAGATVVLRVPVAALGQRCVLADAGGQRIALPVAGVLEVRNGTADRYHVAGGDVVAHAGQALPVRSVANLFGATPLRPGPVVVVEHAGRRGALEVDAIHGVEDVIVKALPAPLTKVPGVVGAAPRSDGAPVVVLDIGHLLQVLGPAAHDGGVAETAPSTAARPHVLIAEDSFTTRTMERNILASAGFEVTTVADGLNAWHALHNAPFDALVTDVVMPGLDGFALSSRIRHDNQLKNLPVIIVTSLGSDEERRRGLEAGADAYLTKSGFDQDDLVSTLRRLL